MMMEEEGEQGRQEQDGNVEGKTGREGRPVVSSYTWSLDAGAAEAEELKVHT